MSCRSSLLITAAVAAGLAGAPQAALAANWADSISLSAYVQGGITGNPGIKKPPINFGHAFTDRANEPLLNQASVTLSRDLDKAATGYDFGFKLQAMYGSDARYTRPLGLANAQLNSRHQFDLVEANVLVHTPWLTEGGIDFKIGLFTTPLGLETIDPTTNAFYTHSYIFNFGLPLKHTGVLATVRVTPAIDLYLGLTTGVNTTFGKDGDNNGSVAGIAGFGITLGDGKFSILALSHFGPENPSRLVPNANRYFRIFNDILFTWKPTDSLTFNTEFNFVKEELGNATAYGAAQYVSYALTDTLKLNARGEVWRDAKGFFVAAFPGNRDFTNAQLGRPATIIGAGPVTYGALTLGVTYSPNIPGPLAGLMIRPELRYDHALAGGRPYNGGRDRGQFTLATDVILKF